MKTLTLAFVASLVAVSMADAAHLRSNFSTRHASFSFGNSWSPSYNSYGYHGYSGYHTPSYYNYGYHSNYHYGHQPSYWNNHGHIGSPYNSNSYLRYSRDGRIHRVGPLTPGS